MVPSPDPLIAYLAENDAPCPGCGYNLRALTSCTCPECGREIVLGDLLPAPPKPDPGSFVLVSIHPRRALFIRLCVYFVYLVVLGALVAWGGSTLFGALGFLP